MRLNSFARLLLDWPDRLLLDWPSSAGRGTSISRNSTKLILPSQSLSISAIKLRVSVAVLLTPMMR